MEKVYKNLLENKWFLLLVSLVYFSAVIVNGSIYWPTLPFYLAAVVFYIFNGKGYSKRVFVTSIILLMVLGCLLLTYIYLSDPSILETPPNLVWFLFLFISTVSCLFYYLYLLFTHKYKKMSI
jgi:hypothetical protein